METSMDNIITSQELALEHKGWPMGNKVLISHRKGFTFFDAADILRFEADGAYTQIILKKGTRFLASRNIGKIEGDIRHLNNFLRVHRSSIINLNEVVHFDKRKFVTMSDNNLIEVSRAKKKVFARTLVGKLA